MGTTMNANKRLEEFLFKLSIRQSKDDLFDKICDHKLMPYIINFILSADKSIKEHNHKLASRLNKEYKRKLINDNNSNTT
jgi:hypothetical protein